MGGGLSSLPGLVDYDTARHFAGELFDADTFYALRDENGMVEKEAIEALVPQSGKEDAYTSMAQLRSIAFKGDVVLVDGPWLVNLHLNDGILPCRQELPEEGIVSPPDLQDDAVQVVVVSWPWLSAQHPDPHGFQLRRIAPVLDVYMRLENKRVAVFLDFCSCFQEFYAPTGFKAKPPRDYPRDRKATTRNYLQANFFRQALVNMNIWYGSSKTMVLVQSALPPLLGKGDDDDGKPVEQLRCTMPIIELNLARHGDQALRAHLDEPREGIGVRLGFGSTVIEDVEVGSRGDLVYGLKPGLRVVAIGHGERGVPQPAETLEEICTILTRLRIVHARRYIVVFEQRPVDTRAWCQFEHSVAEMLTPGNQLLDLGHMYRVMAETQCENVYDFIGKYNKPPRLVFETVQVEVEDEEGQMQIETKKVTKNMGGYGGYKLPETWDEFVTMESHMKGSGNKVVQLLSGRKEAPRHPSAFTAHLDTLLITDTEDRQLLSLRYHEVFNAIFNDRWREELDFSGLGWRFQFKDLWDISISAHFNRIMSLDLSENPELEGSFEVFEPLCEIKMLNLAGCLTFDCSNAMELISSKTWKMKMFLNTLILDRTNVQTDVAPLLEHAGARNMRDLRLNNCWQLTGELDAWQNGPLMRTIESVSMSGCRGILGNLSALSEMASLVSLRLDWCNKIKGTLVPIGQIRTLTELNLTYVEKLEGTLEPLRNNKCLKTLELRACELLEGTLEPLSGIMALTNLNLQGCDQLQGTLEPLQGLTNLKALNLCFCHGLHGDLGPISGLLELSRLELAGEPLRQSRFAGDYTPLRTLTNLKHLNVSHCSALSGEALFRHDHADFLAVTKPPLHPRFQLVDHVKHVNDAEEQRKERKKAEEKALAEKKAAEPQVDAPTRVDPYAKKARPKTPKKRPESPPDTINRCITYDFSRPEEFQWGVKRIRWGGGGGKEEEEASEKEGDQKEEGGD